jgi:hypothetical protein
MAQQPKVYLDDEGNPLGAATGTYLDEQGNQMGEGPEWQGPTLPRDPRAVFGEAALDALNPVNIVKGAWQGLTGELEAGRQAMGEGRPVAGVAHTVASMIPILGPALMNAPDNWRREIAAGQTAMHEGRPVAGMAHTAASAIPILGPVAGDIVSRAESGDVPGAAGQAVGLALGPKVYSGALRAAGAGARAAPGLLPTRFADSLERGAAAKVVDVMAPKVGPNKLRFGGMAEEVAPRIAREPGMGAFSREGLHAKVSTRLEAAENALDAAADARLNAQTFPTQPILNALRQRRQALTAEAVEGSSPIPSIKTVEAQPRPSNRYGEPGFTIPNPGEPIPTRQVQAARPLGRNVVPGPNAARVAVIDQAIEEIKALGPAAKYEPLRRIRQAYDGPAKAIYSPSMTQDFLKAQGGKYGAADVTGTLREALARMDPQTASANAQYSFWRTANDVLEATAEVERTRPKVGRQIMSQLTGALVGTGTSGGTGALAGALTGPSIEAALSRIPPAYRLQSARVMSRLAGAIRRGNLQQVNDLTSQLQRPTPPPGLVPIKQP